MIIQYFKWEKGKIRLFPNFFKKISTFSNSRQWLIIETFRWTRGMTRAMEWPESGEAVRMLVRERHRAHRGCQVTSEIHQQDPDLMSVSEQGIEMDTPSPWGYLE